MNKLDLQYVRHNTGTKSTKIPPSNIRYYELTLLLHGELCYTADGTRIDMKSGDVICLPPDTLRARESGGEKSDYISFNFTSQDPIELPLKLEGAVANDVLLLVAACDEISRTPSLDTDTMEKISHLLSCILLIMKDRERQTEYSPLTLKIMQYLQSNFSERITLDDIGRLTFFSPNYCENVFKRETGRSVIDYLLQIRMEAAKRLLSEGSLALGAVAEAVGFDDYNYFSRVFKKRTGYTPTEYKKLISL